MGGTSFENEYRGAASMADAYRELVEQAFFDQGHDPYNGTISTTSGVIQDPGVAAPLTYAEAMVHLYPERNGGEGKDWWDREPSPQKWEAAWAIPLKAEDNPDPLQSDPWRQHFDKSLPGWLFYGIAAC